MNLVKKWIAISALLATATFSWAQMGGMSDGKKPLSPPASAQCKLASGKMVKIDYSSPRARGRKIFGSASDKALVPYGEVWRTGANAATTFVTDGNVTVGGTAVPAGSYTLFTVPKADGWLLVVSKKTGEWGTDYPGEKEDLARIPMSVGKTSGAVENFTISFDQMAGGCTLKMEWENTKARVDVKGK